MTCRLPVGLAAKTCKLDELVAARPHGFLQGPYHQTRNNYLWWPNSNVNMSNVFVTHACAVLHVRQCMGVGPHCP